MLGGTAAATLHRDAARTIPMSRLSIDTLESVRRRVLLRGVACKRVQLGRGVRKPGRVAVAATIVDQHPLVGTRPTRQGVFRNQVVDRDQVDLEFGGDPLRPRDVAREHAGSRSSWSFVGKQDCLAIVLDHADRQDRTEDFFTHQAGRTTRLRDYGRGPEKTLLLRAAPLAMVKPGNVWRKPAGDKRGALIQRILQQGAQMLEATSVRERTEL